MKREEFSKRYSVCFREWPLERDILVIEDSYALQLTMNCYGCDTCRHIVDHVLQAVERFAAPHVIVLIESQLFLVLRLPDGADPIEVFAQVTDLTVEHHHTF